MKPYYEHAGITIYHGDCREILPQIEAESIITDPVWPDCEHVFPGIDAPRLLKECLEIARVRRISIQVGCFSDVRFLAAVPAIGIEIEERYCEIAAKRLSQEVLQF